MSVITFWVGTFCIFSCLPPRRPAKGELLRKAILSQPWKSLRSYPMNNFKLMEDKVSHEMHKLIDLGFEATVSNWVTDLFKKKLLTTMEVCPWPPLCGVNPEGAPQPPPLNRMLRPNYRASLPHKRPKCAYATEGLTARQGMAWFGYASFHWVKVTISEPSHISATLDQILSKGKEFGILAFTIKIKPFSFHLLFIRIICLPMYWCSFLS